MRTAKKKIAIKDEGLLLVEDVDSLDFVGPGVSGSAIDNDVTEDIGSTLVDQSYETYSKNLKSYPYTIAETSSTVTTISYTTPSGVIIKTITEVSSTVTTIVFSGASYPVTFPTTKTITETSPTLITITYS